MESGTPTSQVASDRSNGPVVVGVDGSEGATAALRFAVTEARRRGAALRVVGAWSIPSSAYMGVPLPTDFAVDCEAAARKSVDQTLAAVGRPADVPVEIVVREGQPGAVLVAEARNAGVLVVGSRGLGGFRELLLGSVSHACVHHASCPVIVVPHPAKAAAERPDAAADAA